MGSVIVHDYLYLRVRNLHVVHETMFQQVLKELQHAFNVGSSLYLVKEPEVDRVTANSSYQCVRFEASLTLVGKADAPVCPSLLLDLLPEIYRSLVQPVDVRPVSLLLLDSHDELMVFGPYFLLLLKFDN